MITDLPNWITAGTAVTAVLGGLFSVYTTTQSRIDVTDERVANTIEILERLAKQQEGLESSQTIISERLIKNEVSADYLKEGQDRLLSSMDTLSGEVRMLHRSIATTQDK